MFDLQKANSRVIFIEKTEAIALTAAQISSIRHVFYGGDSVRLLRLILYVSLNQCHIRVDASGCKILYINVTN
jgi:hypothetical protein